MNHRTDGPTHESIVRFLAIVDICPDANPDSENLPQKRIVETWGIRKLPNVTP